jgi:hypothetical protein
MGRSRADRRAVVIAGLAPVLVAACSAFAALTDADAWFWAVVGGLAVGAGLQAARSTRSALAGGREQARALLGEAATLSRALELRRGAERPRSDGSA